MCALGDLASRVLFLYHDGGTQGENMVVIVVAIKPSLLIVTYLESVDPLSSVVQVVHKMHD